jgi:hypothetical protein
MGVDSNDKEEWIRGQNIAITQYLFHEHSNPDCVVESVARRRKP